MLAAAHASIRWPVASEGTCVSCVARHTYTTGRNVPSPLDEGGGDFILRCPVHRWRGEVGGCGTATTCGLQLEMEGASTYCEMAVDSVKMKTCCRLGGWSCMSRGLAKQSADAPGTGTVCAGSARCRACPNMARPCQTARAESRGDLGDEAVAWPHRRQTLE